MVRVAFIIDHAYQDLWKDGLYMAIERLRQHYTIDIINLRNNELIKNNYDFALGWGAFESPVDTYLQSLNMKRGLCIGGVVEPSKQSYNVVFYETNWFEPFIKDFNRVHAFGINETIFKPLPVGLKLWDHISVGAFASWKRLHLTALKEGNNLVIGEIQKDNLEESMPIAEYLVEHGVSVMGMRDAYTLAVLYNLSRKAYIPATVYGGGERAVLEARACGIGVEVESDNPKLQELTTSPIYDSIYYANQLKKGIDQCLDLV